MASQDSQPFRWQYADLDNRNFQIRGRTLFFVIVLFSIILIVTLLFLYARWICRYRPLPTTTTTTSSTHLAHAPPCHPQGLDPATINSLPMMQHRSSSDTINEAECCICLGLFQDGDKVKVLPECHHFYHSDCVDKWLRTQSSCPLCRASLRVDSAV